MSRIIIIIAGILLVGLGACRTLKERETVEEMQMPPRPDGTARVVLYRIDATTGGRAPTPVLALNGDMIGEMPDETLIIRDVMPGNLEITLELPQSAVRTGIVIDPPLLRAELNAGGEWYIETIVTDRCKTGTKPINLTDVPTGTWQGDAILSGFSLVTAALAYATMECSAMYELKGTWPQSTWNINPLLAKSGAKPVEKTLSDHALPGSGLSWQAVEQTIHHHFATSSDDYKPKLGQYEVSNLLVRKLDPVSDRQGAGDVAVTVDVRVGYLEIDAATLAGRYAEKTLRYSLRRDGEALAVSSWQPLEP